MALPRILVSACLLGQKVRYDGRAKAEPGDLLARWQAEGRIVVFCPEVAAGLPTPRPAAEIEPGWSAAQVLAGDGRVVDRVGGDVTAEFIAGAEMARDLALRERCCFALLTDGSPSCGSSFVYDGTFSGRRLTGRGLTAELLEISGVRVFSPAQMVELAVVLDDAGAPSTGHPQGLPED